MDEIFRNFFYYPDIVYFMRSLYIVVMKLKKILVSNVPKKK